MTGHVDEAPRHGRHAPRHDVRRCSARPTSPQPGLDVHHRFAHRWWLRRADARRDVRQHGATRSRTAARSAGGPYDRHLYPNYLGNNPGNQGRNYSGVEYVKNPFATGAGNEDAYLMVIATTGKPADEMPSATCLDCAKIKLAAFITVVPVAQTPASGMTARARARVAARAAPAAPAAARHRRWRHRTTAATDAGTDARWLLDDGRHRWRGDLPPHRPRGLHPPPPLIPNQPTPPTTRERRTTMRSILLTVIASVGSGRLRRPARLGGTGQPVRSAAARTRTPRRHGGPSMGRRCSTTTSTPSSRTPASSRIARACH